MATVKKLTAGKDTFTGSDGVDTIDALAGDDLLDGAGGNDSLIGNLGNDSIAGGGGRDTLIGGAGTDVVDGGVEADSINGSEGDDILYGGTGVDTILGGIGNDYLYGGADNDKLFGNSGSDAIEGGEGNDVISDANDLKTYGTVSTERDELIGGLGNDILYGGYDFMWGGDGNDTFYVNKIATVYGGLGNDKIFVNNASGGSWLEGGFSNDSIQGGAGPDTIFSGYGNDTLKGGAGNDSYVITIDNFYTDDSTEKDTGYDTIDDTLGNDTVYYIRDFEDDGRDDDVGSDGKELDPTVKTNDYYMVLPDDIENGVLDNKTFLHRIDDGGNYVIAWLEGNSRANVLTGSDLYDVLDGAGGNDTVYGGEGNDVIFFGEGNDNIDGEAGEDWVASRKDFNLAKDGKNFENIDLGDFSTAITATGDNFNNVLVGNSENNKLIGLAGNDTFGVEKDTNVNGVIVSNGYDDSGKGSSGTDTMIGGAGDDLYYVDSTDDKIIEIATTGGNDTIRYAGTIATTTYPLPTGVENLVMVSNVINASGNNLNNKITGSSSANKIESGYGDDYLDGGSGIDTFVGGYGDDTFVVDKIDERIEEIEGQGSDWVQSSAVTLDLSNNNWGSSIENARLTGTTSLLDLYGSAVNNELVGNSGNNRLDGKGGKDTLQGGLGNDTYVVDTTTDSLIEVVNSIDTSTGKIKAGWIDTIQSYVNFSLENLLNFENITLLDEPGTKAKTATGNTNDNTLIGSNYSARPKTAIVIA